MSEENLAQVESNPLLENGNPAPNTETKTETPIIENKTEIKPVTPEVPAQLWPDNWRDLMAGQDAKFKERLARFTDPGKVGESYRNLETKLSSGQYKPVLSDKATPEEVAAYRKASGIPEKAEGYLSALPEGYVIGEEDKPMYLGFAEKLHARNADPAIFQDVVDMSLALIEQNMNDTITAQTEYKEATRHQLYQEWGAGEYKMNVNAVANWLQGAPEDLREVLEGAQLADGNLMFNDARFLKFIAQHLRDTNPAMAIMPAGGGDAIDALQAKLADNRNLMRTPSEWFKKENAARREEHTRLLEMEQKITRRA